MYTFEWKAAENNDLTFDGSVMIKVPNHIVRLAFLKDIRTYINPSGEMMEDKSLELSTKLIEFALKQIDKVALVRKSDGKVITDAEWLLHDADGAAVLSAIGTKLIHGIQLGKN